MTSFLFLFSLLAASPRAATLPATSTAPAVEVGPNVRVSEPGVVHVEPHMAAHPDRSQEAHRLGLGRKAP
jgi:hypothetical protein